VVFDQIEITDGCGPSEVTRLRALAVGRGARLAQIVNDRKRHPEPP